MTKSTTASSHRLRRRTRALCSSSRFVAIQKRSSNLKDGKQSAAMVPQVKGLAYVTDPSMQHLL